MALTKIWDYLADLLDVADEFVEDKVEFAYGTVSTFLDNLIADKNSKFGKKGKEIIGLGIRDKLIKKYPLEDFPVD
jgi:hypothetical protein